MDNCDFENITNAIPAIFYLDNYNTNSADYEQRVTINDCTFKNIDGTIGAIMYFSGDSVTHYYNVKFSDCYFTSNFGYCKYFTILMIFYRRFVLCKVFCE